MRTRLIIIAVIIVLGGALLSGCDTRHIVEVCQPIDSIAVSDSLIVFHKTPCL